MEFRNGRLLQLIECIESTQNEVKRKMIESSALHDAPKSPGVTRARKKWRGDHIVVLRSGRRGDVLAFRTDEQHFLATQHGSEVVKRCSPLPR
jgi:hypothetical protein